MIANLPYLNKLVAEYNIITMILLVKNLLMLIILLLLKTLSQILNLLSLKLMIESELQSIRIFLVKATLEAGQEKYLLLIRFENYSLDILK